MKTPTFPIQGGKARLCEWLIPLFPKTGRHYSEWFAGRGNVFFAARKYLWFQRWHLNELDGGFFEALLSGDATALPDRVEREEFERWRERAGQGCLTARLLEPRITYGGNGYGRNNGFRGSLGGIYPTGTTYCTVGRFYRATCKEARRLLELPGLERTSGSWESLDASSYNDDDFVYLDPPYWGTVSSYPNINHDHLCEVLNEATFRWALSGYDNPIYRLKLKYVNLYQRHRNTAMRDHRVNGEYGAIESLWTNY